MELNLKSLQDAGAFAGAPVKKEIKWKQGDEEFTVTAFVRKLSYRTAVSDTKLHYAGGDIVAGRIASCICDKDGNPVFSVEDITGDSDKDRGPLNHSLTIAMLDAIAEVNYPVKKKKG